LKLLGLALGVASIIFGLIYLYGELGWLARQKPTDAGDILVVLSTIALVLAGCALVAQLPQSLRARFRQFPLKVVRGKPTYGFGTMLAVGVGATLGSPLFILIPDNIVQYEIISVLSLIIAAVLSVAMAKVYADMYRDSKELGLEGVGGPSFTKIAVGSRSVRYFVSRLSMWVANTALAAYTKIVFLIFVLDPDEPFLPWILIHSGLGLNQFEVDAIVYAVAGGFVAWTVLNILFEQRYLRLIGMMQILMTAALVIILVYHSAVLGANTSWDLANIFHGFDQGWFPKLVINTGYLYLLFFGFQEIQSLERDAVERSPIPLISWVKRGITIDRTKYFGIAMVFSVVLASAINILYGLASYSNRALLSATPAPPIPAVTLAERLGGGQELLVGAAFLIATITTFVPAFLAASRHLSALGEDGYMPHSLASLSWVFTLVAIFLLAVGPQDFLVSITDFMVLISLGIISLSAVWLRRRFSPWKGRWPALPLLVGASCFLFGGAVFYVEGESSVVVFGSMAIIFGYLLFDILELGAIGIQLFLSMLCLACVTALTTFKHASGFNVFGADPNNVLFYGLVACAAMLVENVLLDFVLVGRTFLRRAYLTPRTLE
jgi:hypothetical protein